MRWLVADSLSHPDQFFCSHLDSYSHYLREAGEDSGWLQFGSLWVSTLAYQASEPRDVLFALDYYGVIASWPATVRIAQVAAICNPMPWDVRKPDGSPAYDLIISSLRWMVEEARAHGCRAEYQPLAFDTRARVCGMGVARDLDLIHVGTVGPNHQRRAQVLAALGDRVQCFPATWGREYFKLLGRAKEVVNVHAEWARGELNNMRMYEAPGMGATNVGVFNEAIGLPEAWVLKHETYESRIQQLIAWARELYDAKGRR